MSRGRCGRKNRAAAATCGRGRCDSAVVAAIFLRFLRLTPKIASGYSDFFLRAGDAKKPCDFCSGRVASPLAATVGPLRFLRCDFCAAKVGGAKGEIEKALKMP